MELDGSTLKDINLVSKYVKKHFQHHQWLKLKNIIQAVNQPLGNEALCRPDYICMDTCEILKILKSLNMKNMAPHI